MHVFSLSIANTSIICLNEHPVIVVGFVVFWFVWVLFFFLLLRLPFVLWYISTYSGADFMLFLAILLLQPLSSF